MKGPYKDLILDSHSQYYVDSRAILSMDIVACTGAILRGYLKALTQCIAHANRCEALLWTLQRRSKYPTIMVWTQRPCIEILLELMFSVLG